jgi:hypothetical protein
LSSAIFDAFFTPVAQEEFIGEIQALTRGIKMQ